MLLGQSIIENNKLCCLMKHQCKYKLLFLNHFFHLEMKPIIGNRYFPYHCPYVFHITVGSRDNQAYVKLHKPWQYTLVTWCSYSLDHNFLWKTGRCIASHWISFCSWNPFLSLFWPKYVGKKRRQNYLCDVIWLSKLKFWVCDSPNLVLTCNNELEASGIRIFYWDRELPFLFLYLLLFLNWQHNFEVYHMHLYSMSNQ